MPVRHLVCGAWLIRGPWTRGRGKRHVSGVQGQMHGASLTGSSCRAVGDRSQASEPEGPSPARMRSLPLCATLGGLSSPFSTCPLFQVPTPLPPSPCCPKLLLLRAPVLPCDSLPPSGPPASLKVAICRCQACPSSMGRGRSRWEGSQVLGFKARHRACRDGVTGLSWASAAPWEWAVERLDGA